MDIMQHIIAAVTAMRAGDWKTGLIEFGYALCHVLQSILPPHVHGSPVKAEMAGAYSFAESLDADALATAIDDCCNKHGMVKGSAPTQDFLNDILPLVLAAIAVIRKLWLGF